MNRGFILLTAVLAGSVVASVDSPSQLMFEVRRDGETIGTHCLKFRRQGARLDVEVAMDLEIPLPLWFDYGYRYRASERWLDGRLVALDVVIDDGGERRRIEARRRDDILVVDAPDGQWRLPGDLLTSNHWNPAALAESRLLNTLTGRASRIDSEFLGTERSPFGDDAPDLSRYRLGGELEDTLVWYDDGGGWRGLEFSARDGSRIRLSPLSPESHPTFEPSQTPWNRNPLCRPGQPSG